MSESSTVQFEDVMETANVEDGEADLTPSPDRADVAREVLLRSARIYRSLVSYAELAAEIEQDCGSQGKQAQHAWVGEVLGRVADECTRREEPILSALCVNASGTVGASYAASIARTRGETTTNPDAHAADERLACYRFFEATDLPEGGGKAALSPKLAAAQARLRKAEMAMRPVNTCARCNMAIPPTGLCDNCD